MRIKYLGTAAAEAIPAIFCQCDVCKAARKNGGRDIRKRSGVVIDDELLIDFSPDIYAQSLNYNLDLSKIKDILITHTHADHFDAAELMMRMPNCYCYINEGEQFVNLYGNKKTGELLKLFAQLEFGNDGTVDFIKYTELEAFKQIKVANYNVTPVLAAHMPSEKALNYILEKDNKTILYAHDTGFFTDETFDFLNKTQIKFDFISFDCTTALKYCEYGHMGIPNILKVKDILEKQGNLKPSTKYVVSHFSHNGGSLYDELVDEVSKYKFKVAYDGMEIEI